MRDYVPFVSLKQADDDVVILCKDGLYSVAASCMVDLTVDEIKKRIGTPEDDVSLIKIS